MSSSKAQTPTPATDTCLCGSKLPLTTCGLPMIEGKKAVKTAEELLRARYTAFVRGDIEFILDTHHSKTRAEVNREEIEDWSRNSEWLGLQIFQTEGGAEKDSQAAIVFCAEYKADGKLVKHWEQSLFEKEDGAWRFLDARGLKNDPIRRAEPKAGRNDPCPCGSGQKFKKWCGK